MRSAPARSRWRVGFVLVIVFMATFYGLFGWFANIALVVNLVLMLAVMSLLQATLTLPGMAGILLTLGMAVDANILINERIREEQRNGRPPLQAMETRVPACLSNDLRLQRHRVPGARDAVHLRLRAGARIRGDDHGGHRDQPVHRLDAGATAGVALVYRGCARGCCRSEDVLMFFLPAYSAWLPTRRASSSCAAGSWG